MELERNSSCTRWTISSTAEADSLAIRRPARFVGLPPSSLSLPVASPHRFLSFPCAHRCCLIVPPAIRPHSTLN